MARDLGNIQTPQSSPASTGSGRVLGDISPQQSQSGYTAPQPAQPQQSLADSIWAGLANAGHQIGSAFNGGIQQAQQGYQDASTATNPLQKTEAGMKELAGGVNALSAPLAPITAPLGNATAGAVNAISDMPSVQKFAMSGAGRVASRVAEDVNNTSTVAPTVLGTLGAGEIANDVGNIKNALGAPKGAGYVADALNPKPEVTVAPEQQLKAALDMTSPTLGKKGSISALERSGQPGGAVAPKGMFGKTTVAPSPRDIQVAQSVQDAVVPGKPIDTIANINGKIESTSEGQVRPFLQQNPAAFNVKTLNAYIRDNTNIPNYIKADPVLEKTYELTRQSMLDEVASQPKTMEGLWDARKSFDHVADTQGVGLDPTSEKISVIKQAVLDTRRAVNDFIVENTPSEDATGRNTFSDAMQQMNRMYDARTRIATSNYKNLGQGAISAWMKANPGKTKLIEYGLGAAGVGAAAKAGFSLIP